MTEYRTLTECVEMLKDDYKSGGVKDETLDTAFFSLRKAEEVAFYVNEFIRLSQDCFERNKYLSNASMENDERTEAEIEKIIKKNSVIAVCKYINKNLAKCSEITVKELWEGSVPELTNPNFKIYT